MAGNLAGNDELRQLFAGRPDMAGWLDEREARVRGLDAAPTPQVQAPAGMSQDFYQAMVASGATPFEPPETAPAAPPPTDSSSSGGLPLPPIVTGIGDGIPGNLPAASVGRAPSFPELPPSAPAMPAFTPPIPAAPNLQPLPRQAPVMSQVSPAPAAPAVANINNAVTMPTPTFTSAAPRPNLPTTQAQGLAPNLGAYAPAPSMPGYGLPRLGTPFRPAAPQGLPTFAAFGGLPSYSTQPTNQEPDPGLYGGFAGAVGKPGLSLFDRY